MSKIEEGFEKAKNFLQSKTIWGIAIMVLSFVLGPELITDIGSTVEDAKDVVVGGEEAANSLWSQITFTAGAILSLWGRIKAQTKVVLGKGKD